MSFRINCGTDSCTNNNITDIITLVEQNDTKGSYEITPNSQYTVYRFEGPLIHNTTVEFTINTTSSNVGDQMVWLINSELPNGDISIILPSITYYTSC